MTYVEQDLYRERTEAIREVASAIRDLGSALTTPEVGDALRGLAAIRGDLEFTVKNDGELTFMCE